MSIKEALAAVAVGAAVNTINSITTPVFGGSVALIGGAFIGSVLSFVVGQPAKSHQKLFGLAILGTVFGAVLAAMLPHVIKWTGEVQGPVAICGGLIARHWISPLIERGQELIKSFTPSNLFKK